MKKQNKLLVIEGATASGKTAISIEIAKRLDGEIISADSMQIYEGMNIGTGKVTESEASGIKHHMLDIAKPTDKFSVAEYVERTKGIIADLFAKGKVPIIVGGTGLYIDGILEKKSYGNAIGDERIREKYQKILEEKGKIYLHELLKSIDKGSYEKLFPNDTKRVIRALEISEITGCAKSTIKDAKEYRYDFSLFCLTHPREILYKRINERVDQMKAHGLIDEIKGLVEKYGLDAQAFVAIGYKEIIAFLKGDITEEESFESVKQNSRKYAKRQMTWFNHHNSPTIIDMTLPIEENIKSIIDIFLSN